MTTFEAKVTQDIPANRLIGLAQQITAKPNPRELDMILTTGEQVTIGLLAIALESIGVPAISFTGQKILNPS